MSHNLDWMDRAACVGHPDPDLFFPSQTGMASRKQAHEASLVCRGCPVVLECREHKRKTGSGSGVWGGKGGVDRTTASTGGPQKPQHGRRDVPSIRVP